MQHAPQFRTGFALPSPAPCYFPEALEDSYWNSKAETSFKKPTIVLVPGAFALEDLYESLISKLHALHYDVEFAGLDSILPLSTLPEERPPAATLDDDVSCVRRIVTKLANDGKDILLVGHGYGALPANESCRSWTKLERITRGLRGGIMGVLYITGFVPSIGQNLMELVQKFGRTTEEGNTMILDGSSYATANVPSCASLVCYSYPREKALEVVDRFGYQSLNIFADRATFAPWQEVPVSFLYCLNDGINPVFFQREQVKMMEKDSGEDIRVFECEGGHHPNVTEPDTVARFIRIAAGEIDEDDDD